MKYSSEVTMFKTELQKFENIFHRVNFLDITFIFKIKLYVRQIIFFFYFIILQSDHKSGICQNSCRLNLFSLGTLRTYIPLLWRINFAKYREYTFLWGIVYRNKTNKKALQYRFCGSGGGGGG